MIVDPDHVVAFTKAAIALHNFLRTAESSVYCPPGFLDGEDGGDNGNWRQEFEGSSFALAPLRQAGGNRYSLTASTIRDTFRDYFTTSVGMLSGQYQHVHRTS